MKSNRQDEILRIIANNEVETQEELAEALREHGYQVTQATISRDIKELRLIKIAGSRGNYRYARPDRQETAVSDRLIRILTDSMIGVDSTGQIVVAKTLSGSANVAAEAIDMMNWPEIVGTIAGDNTIFIAARTPEDAAEITSKIRKFTAIK